jgi:hypothetical protein
VSVRIIITLTVQAGVAHGLPGAISASICTRGRVVDVKLRLHKQEDMKVYILVYDTA